MQAAWQQASKLIDPLGIAADAEEALAALGQLTDAPCTSALPWREQPMFSGDGYCYPGIGYGH